MIGPRLLENFPVTQLAIQQSKGAFRWRCDLSIESQWEPNCRGTDLLLTDTLNNIFAVTDRSIKRNSLRATSF